jgi:predicted NAD/FAD-dependent oxidoreductase
MVVVPDIPGLAVHDDVPPHLLERLRPAADHLQGAPAESALYWTHNALRPQENQGLDVALVAAELIQRLTLHWPEQSNPAVRFTPTALPLEPVDLATADLIDLIAAYDIDHSIGSVPDTFGGSRAGYARWEAFKVRGLQRYADDHHDAIRDGISRISPYLQNGMVSQFRVAREAAAVWGPGGEKDLDELHNNVRMTWRKAFPNWTVNAADALRRMVDLNHTYARDGRDPASYGGLLWCLGQFDRPYAPQRPVSAVVHTPPTEEQVAQLDPEGHTAKVSHPSREPMPRVAIVGAGISGLTCARSLADHGFLVTVFDKGRAAGGRIATRRIEPALTFDHGAQFFTARNPDFARQVQAWCDRGVVSEWNGRIVNLKAGVATDTSPQSRYVGVPGMSAVAAHLAADVAVHRKTRITQLTRSGEAWELMDESGARFGPFEFLVLTLPAPQAAELLAPHPFADAAAAVRMSPCWAALVAFDVRYHVPWDGAFVHGSPLSWVSRNSSKPGRPAGPDCWVLHADPEWSATHLEERPELVASRLLDAIVATTGVPVPPAIHLSAHRWRFSLGSDSADHRSLFDPDAGLVVCGDWLADGRVEGAFLAGTAAAGFLLRHVVTPESGRVQSPISPDP